MVTVKGRIHGRDQADMPAVFIALSELPGYEVTGEYTAEGWQVRYAHRNAATAQASWDIAGRAVRAAGTATSTRTDASTDASTGRPSRVRGDRSAPATPNAP